MTLPTLKTIANVTVALLAIAGVTGTAHAATLLDNSAVPAMTTLTSPNQVVVVKHLFPVKYFNNETASCGIRMEFSDRTPAKNYTLTKSTTPNLLTEERSYHLPGTYSVTVSGQAWGGYVACLGQQTSTTVIKPMEAGKITSITTPSPSVVSETTEGVEVPFTINGEGKACTLQVYPHNQQDPKILDVSVASFPTTVKIKFPHKADDYKMLAWGHGAVACGGTAEVNLKTRIKLSIGISKPKTPTITGLYVKSQTSLKEGAAHIDEAITFSVGGNLINISDPALQCGWSLFLVDSQGKGKLLTTGNTFDTLQTLPAGALSAFPLGDYTLHAKSTAADDMKANQSCIGEANKKFKLFQDPGAIKDVKLKAFAYHYNAVSEHGHTSPGGEDMGGRFCENCTSIFSPPHDKGFLRIVPVFASGATCSYTVTQAFKGQQTKHLVVYNTATPSETISGVDSFAQPRLNVYPDNETIVVVTLTGAPGPGGPCSGSVTKTITVRDDPKLPAVNK